MNSVVKTDDELIYKNKANYGFYAPIIDNGVVEINASNIDVDDVEQHIDWILNIYKDGIYMPKIQNLRVIVNFADKRRITMLLEDYVVNLIFWKLTINIGEPVTSECLFFNKSTTTGYIGKYINRMYIKKSIKKIKETNTKMTIEILLMMNTVINDVFESFKKFIPFQMYLNNTLCLEDTLDLMNQYPEFNDSMHLRLAGTPLSEVGRIGTEAANTQIKYITAPSSNHCLKYFFISGECVNAKQYKEVAAHVGPKPNGEGGIIPAMIDASYLNGGLSTPEAYTIDASASRVAQMLSHENVGKSGDFARILELNSTDTELYLDSRYKCDTKNTIRVTIKDRATLNLYDKRYYRFRRIVEDGHEPDKLIDADTDTWLIGKTIELYSPMTCASHARGEGICYRCYGDLAYTNFNIKAGVIATELLSSKYTQIQLSAKHLLEAHIRALEWNLPIEDIFDINFNTLKCYTGPEGQVNYHGMKLVINAGDINLEDDSDDLEYNAYVSGFGIIDANGNRKDYYTVAGDNIYMSDDLNEALADAAKKMKNYDEDKDDIIVPLSELTDIDQLFLFHITNDELSRIVAGAKKILNKSSETGKFTKDEILDEFVSINMSGNIRLDSVHYEVIIANQMRDPNNTFMLPDWSEPNPDYLIWTLNKSLLENPRVAISLQYQKITQQVWKPITFLKNKSSSLDLFFMERPQDRITTPGLVNKESEKEEGVDRVAGIEPVSFNNNIKGAGIKRWVERKE